MSTSETRQPAASPRATTGAKSAIAGAKSAIAGAPRERTLDEMADAYSRRAREARAKQGKPPVITGSGVLNRLAEIMASEDPQSQRPGLPAA